jgi:DNA-binding SARP family transcriptional activator
VVSGPDAVAFRLLGPLEVVRDGELVALGGAKHRILLSVLLLSPNQVVPTERLVDHLWRERPPPSAPASIHVYVSHLRRALGADAGQHLIVTRRPGYALQVDPEQIDAARFEALLADARRARDEGAIATVARTLAEALALWRGDPLPDLAGDPFAEADVVRLCELRLSAVEDRIDADLALGRHTELVAELEHLVEAWPFRERLRGQFMLALYRCDRQADALAAYRRGRAALVEQLGVDPGPTLQRLETKILQQSPDLDWRPAERRRLGRSAAPVSTAPLLATSTFIGRSRELEVLESALQSVTEGRGALVLVAGEPGIGKTRLAEELAARAEATGFRVLWGRCFEGEGAPPFWPWLQALRDLGGPGDGELTDLLPGEGGAPAAAEPGSARVQLFDAVARRLRTEAGSTPLVLVFDDLHWADTPSLLLLQYLGRELATMGVLVVGLYRDTEPDRTALHEAVGRLSPESVTARLHLGGFGTGELAEFLTALGLERPARLGTDLLRRTEGNPFFVREVLRLLDTAGHLTDGSGDPAAVPVPTTVRDVVRSRVGRLSGETGALLELASVVGREFDLDVLEGLVSDGGDPVALLEEAMAAGLVEEAAGGSVGRFSFTHALVQEALYDRLAAVRRARLHGRVAEVLVSLEGPDPARRLPELAAHFCRAAAGGRHVDEAVRYAVAAAEAATAALAYEEAVGLYERALGVIDARGPRDAEAARFRCGLLLQLGDARWRAGDVTGARTVFLTGAGLARSLDDAPLLGCAVLGWGGGPYRAWHAARGEVSDVIIDHLEAALAGLGRGDDDLGVRLLGYRAEQLYFDGGDCELRDQLSARALAMARRLDDPMTLASALSSRCLAVWDPDHLDERLDLAAEVLTLATTLGNDELILFGQRHRLVALLEAGRVDESRAVLADLVALAEEARQPLYRWEARWLSALLVLQDGAFEEGERLALEALELGQVTSDPDAVSIFGAQLAVIRREQDRVEEMRDAVLAFSEEFADIPAWRAGVALLQAELGELDEARIHLDRLAASGFADVPFDFVWPGTMAMLAQTCALVGDAERAGVLHAQLLSYAGHNLLTADRTSWGPGERYLGLLAATEGRTDEAQTRFEAAAAASRAMGARPWEAHALLDHARLLVAHGGAGAAERAAALAKGALAIGEELGMARLARDARQLVPPASP